MIIDVIENSDYKNLVVKQLKETIEYLKSIDQEFAVTANIKGLEFNPPLPEPIFSQFAPFSLFVLSNYTYESVTIEQDAIMFEAGFGKENFGSVVTLPYYAIFQIIVDDSILYINSAATVDSFFEKSEDKLKKSMNIFKSNKKNKNLLK